MVILFTIKNHLCAGDYAAAVCAIKSAQLKQGQTTRCVFLNTRTYPSLFRKRFNFFVIRKATFRTQKHFHNKQYTPKSKDQPFESDRTHFDTGFNNGNYANAPSDLYFSSFAQNHNRSIKNNQPEQSIRKNKAPQPLNQKHPKTNTTSNYEKMQYFLNIKISQTATCFELTEIAPLIKTQYNRKKTKQPSRHFEIIIQ